MHVLPAHRQLERELLPDAVKSVRCSRRLEQESKQMQLRQLATQVLLLAGLLGCDHGQRLRDALPLLL